MSSCTWLLQQTAAVIIGRHNFLVQKLEMKIVSMVCIIMRTASLRPVTILPQICTVWSTKLQKHFNNIKLNLLLSV